MILVKTFQSGDKELISQLQVKAEDKESGEQKSITEWHKVAIFNNALVEIADKFVKKGMKIILNQLQTRKWQILQVMTDIQQRLFYKNIEEN